MGRRKTVKLGETPAYPNNAQVKEYARLYRLHYMDKNHPETSHHVFKHDQTLDVLVTWGVNNIFFAYAYPPAGFTIVEPEDVTKLVQYDGYILEYKPVGDIWNVLVRATKDGFEFFQSEKRKYKPM